MTYQVLARRLRPQRFADVVGQDHVTRTLQAAIAAGRVAHAFLFSGPRGVGKTTTARLLAKALNCERGPTPEPCNACSNCKEIGEGSAFDVLEIDGASHTQVDKMRDLMETVAHLPLKSRFKVFIIDEVHMLSSHSFNALLKTLGAATAREVHLRHHRAAQGAGDGGLTLPALRPPAHRPGGAARAPPAHGRCRGARALGRSAGPRGAGGGGEPAGRAVS